MDWLAIPWILFVFFLARTFFEVVIDRRPFRQVWGLDRPEPMPEGTSWYNEIIYVKNGIPGVRVTLVDAEGKAIVSMTRYLDTSVWSFNRATEQAKESALRLYRLKEQYNLLTEPKKK